MNRNVPDIFVGLRQLRTPFKTVRSIPNLYILDYMKQV